MFGARYQLSTHGVTHMASDLELRITYYSCIISVMARPLRLEFPNALYHITSRGDRRENIYDDDTDRIIFMETLGTWK